MRKVNELRLNTQSKTDVTNTFSILPFYFQHASWLHVFQITGERHFNTPQSPPSPQPTKTTKNGQKEI